MKEKVNYKDCVGKDMCLYDIVVTEPNSGLFLSQFGYIVKSKSNEYMYEIEWAYSGKGTRTSIDFWLKRGLISIANVQDDMEYIKNAFKIHNPNCNIEVIKNLIEGKKEELDERAEHILDRC